MKKRLRARRVERGWSQAELAGRIGVAQSLVSTWESGAKRPGLDQLRRLAAALDVPILFLLEGHAELDRQDTAAELRWWGLDVHRGDVPLWAVRRLEETLAEALREADPRLVDRLPALFTLHPRLEAGLLAAHASRLDVGRRLGWLRDVTRALVELGVGRPSVALAQLDVAAFRPPRDAAWDSLGYPAPDRSVLPAAWQRWRVDYDRSLADLASVVRGVLSR